MPNFAPSLIATLLWGAMFTIAATAIDRVDAVNLTAVRYVIASAIFLALLAAVEGRESLRLDGRLRHTVYIGTAGFAGFNLLSFAALERVSPEQAALVVATTPLVTLLFRWARERIPPTRVQLACVVVAFTGVALVLTGGDLGSIIDGGLGIGHLMVFGAVVAWVRYIIGTADFPTWSPLRFSALTASLGTVSILAITLVADVAGWLSPPGADDIGAILPQLAYLVFGGAIVAVLSWNAGIYRLGPANAALFMNLVPVVAFAIEAARGTNPTLVEVAGAALTVAALVVANVAGRRASAREAAQERDDGLDEVVGLGRGGERVEVARG